MPENSPSRTTPNNHPATKALEIRARELDILARTGIDASKLSAKAEDESTTLILESHQAELTGSDTTSSTIAHLNDLRNATERLLRGDTPEDVRESLNQQGFEKPLTSLSRLPFSLSQNGSEDGAS